MIFFTTVLPNKDRIIYCFHDSAGFGNGDKVRAVRPIYKDVQKELPAKNSEEDGGEGRDESFYLDGQGTEIDDADANMATRHETERYWAIKF